MLQIYAQKILAKRLTQCLVSTNINFVIFQFPQSTVEIIFKSKANILSILQALFPTLQAFPRVWSLLQ